MPFCTVGCGLSCGDGSGEALLDGDADGDAPMVGCAFAAVSSLLAAEFGVVAELHPMSKQTELVRIIDLITQFSLCVLCVETCREQN